MELTHLRYFVHVATAKSFSAGAARAHVSPPAMSKAIRKLEDELGAPLFERTTRRVVLTGEGERLLVRCRDILAQIDAIPHELAAPGGAVTGDLRIAAMEVFSIHLLPAALAALVREHPGVTPLVSEMVPDQMERHLAEGSLDVGLTIGGGAARGVVYETLGASPGVVVCGRSHPLHDRGRITAADLARHAFVVPRFFQREHLPSLDQFPEVAYPRRVGATIELMQMAIELAIAGAYLAHLPTISVAHHLESKSLRALRGLGGEGGTSIVNPGEPFQLRMLLRPGGSQRPAIVALRRELDRLIAAAERSAKPRRRRVP